ncbi:alpha-L-glutamate ligase [Methylocucumis oryzae]|uniref:Alpha-L-glutamate ligase n=2 Tax=Methylocucumis oryzae TaxID=1632867 RepID=A0A0F3IHA4_9GAMM|nr:alpha-L-glutamate ligase [Methylocucumis oryzae]
MLCDAFQAKGFSALYASLTACHFSIAETRPVITIPGLSNALPDVVFVRGVPGGSLEEVVFYLDVLHALAELGIPVYNSGRAIERSVDKAMTSFLLHKAGLPTPVTWVLRDRQQALDIAETELAAGNWLLSKPLFGSQGEGIRRLEKQTDLLWLTGSRGIYYLQRFVHSLGEGCSDFRVFVINHRVVAAMRRRGKFWLNNVAKGASCDAVVADEQLASLAISATKVLAMDYAGVDILQQQDGSFTIIEVNSIPAWKGLQSVCDVNIADLLVNDLLTRYV